MSSADPVPGGRFRRLLLGAGLAIGDHVVAVVDEAAARVDADAETVGRDPSGTRSVERTAGDVVVPITPRTLDVDPTLRHVVIGAVTEAGDRTVGLVVGAGHLVGSAAEWIGPVTGWAWRAPMLQPVRSRTDETLRRLAQRGRHEEVVARRQAHETFGLTVATVSASVVIDQVIGEVLDRNLQPILDSALPVALGGLQDRPELLVPLVESIVGQVLQPILDTAIPNVMGDLQTRPELIIPLVETIVGKALQPILDQALPLVMDDIARQPALLMPLVMGIVDEALEPLLKEALPRVIEVLNEDPDAIRSLMRDQSTGIAVEMTETVRFKAADADERIDRIVRRVLRRKPVRIPPPAVPDVVGHPELTTGSRAVRLEALPVSSDPATVAAEPVRSEVAAARRDEHPSVDLPDGGRR